LEQINNLLFADMATSIAHLISLEVIHMIDAIFCSRFLATVWHRTPIATRDVEVVIYMAAEVGRAMKPRACSNEDAAAEPLGTVVAIWGARVWWSFVVAVWAVWRYANIDGHLSRGGFGS
jgi:hypothetical protein